MDEPPVPTTCTFFIGSIPPVKINNGENGVSVFQNPPNSGISTLINGINYTNNSAYPLVIELHILDSVPSHLMVSDEIITRNVSCDGSLSRVNLLFGTNVTVSDSTRFGTVVIPPFRSFISSTSFPLTHPEDTARVELFYYEAPDAEGCVSVNYDWQEVPLSNI